MGGGPAGSACAWRLKHNNMDVIVLDQASFPRFKPCAGWITPEVVQDLELNLADYPFSFTTFSSFQVSVRGIHFKLRTHQHAIRRYEFDDYLLRRACVPVHAHTVKTIELAEDGGYVLDGEYNSRYLVGAGGTHCPVYRTLFRTDNPKDKESQIVAQEEEFPYDYTDERCQLWFLENKLPGYGWYVPKKNGYVNVGVGGKAGTLNANGDSLKNHWNFLVEKLEQRGLVRGHTYKPSAHTYYLRQRLAKPRKGNAFVVGDAAGLATLEMGEGIGPAIRSGLLAADSIVHGSDYFLSSIPRYSLFSLIRWGFRHP